jgi:Leucine-rich repeat (LRR) protein
MKKIILLLAWATIATGVTAQTYHPHDVGKLREFLKQPAVNAGFNGGLLNLWVSDMETWETSEDWVPKVAGVTWSDEIPKRITEIDWDWETAYGIAYYLSGDLDLSGCTSLTRYASRTAQLSSLNVSGCTSLTSLNCWYGRLTSLDISTCGSLETFGVYSNPLTDLTVGWTAIPSLKSLFLPEDVSQATLHVPKGSAALYRSADEWKKFGNIVESGEVAQEYNAHDLGKLKAFLKQPSGVSGKLNGEQLGLTSAEMSGMDTNEDWVVKLSSQINNGAEYIVWEGSPRRISEINLRFQCERLSGSMDFSGCASLTVLSCQGGPFTEIDVRGCTLLDRVNCHDTGVMRRLLLDGCTSLKTLNCAYNQVSDFDLSGCPALENVYCSQMYQMRRFDFSRNPALKNVDCSAASLWGIEVDVSGCPELESLDCFANYIEELDLRNNLKLTHVHCGEYYDGSGGIGHMYVSWLVPPALTPEVFTLHVPRGTADLYRAAVGWKARTIIDDVEVASSTYASHDLSRLRSFLQQVPTKSGSSNGELLGLTSDDMSTWLTSDAWVEKLAGVSWSDVSPKRIISIDWHDRGLCGVLDVSGLSSLSSLNCSANFITSLDISSLPALSELWCHGNPLSDITVSWQEPKSITSLGSGGSDWLLLHLPLVLSSTLHVPAGSAALYRSADGWGMFRTITESPYVANINVARPEVIVFVTANTLTINSPSSEVITLYSLSGVTLLQSSKAGGITNINLSRLPKGVILVSGSSGWTRKILR